MYRTSHSTRILKGAESVLFREGLGSLFEQTSDTIQVETGVDAFDGLSSEQKHVLLAQIGKALLYENVPAPKRVRSALLPAGPRPSRAARASIRR